MQSSPYLFGILGVQNLVTRRDDGNRTILLNSLTEFFSSHRKNDLIMFSINQPDRNVSAFDQLLYLLPVRSKLSQHDPSLVQLHPCLLVINIVVHKFVHAWVDEPQSIQ